MIGDNLARLARSVLRVRQQRSTYLPAAIFGGEEAWDLLLVLFVADAEGRRLTGRAAMDEIRGSRHSGRRWIQFLTSDGLIVGDGQGNLDDTLTLTPRGLNALEGWLDMAMTAFVAAR